MDEQKQPVKKVFRRNQLIQRFWRPDYIKVCTYHMPLCTRLVYVRGREGGKTEFLKCSENHKWNWNFKLGVMDLFPAVGTYRTIPPFPPEQLQYWPLQLRLRLSDAPSDHVTIQQYPLTTISTASPRQVAEYSQSQETCLLKTEMQGDRVGGKIRLQELAKISVFLESLQRSMRRSLVDLGLDGCNV